MAVLAMDLKAVGGGGRGGGVGVVGRGFGPEQWESRSHLQAVVQRMDSPTRAKTRGSEFSSGDKERLTA